METDLRRQLKQALGPHWTTRLRCLHRGKRLPRWGNLRNTHPFSDYFGFDRGTPIDRYYVHHFFDENRTSVTGDVLEIQGNGYTRRYGHDLRRAESLDINPAVNPTFLCDLAMADTVLDADSYDCFLLPNSFQHMRNLEPAMRQALRIVQDGGNWRHASGVKRKLRCVPMATAWRRWPRCWGLRWKSCRTRNCSTRMTGIR